MKKTYRMIAAAALAAAVATSASPSSEAANFMPIYAEPTPQFPFTDVPAERKEMISALYQNKFLNGVSANQFGWNQTIKRVDAAVITARGMGFKNQYTLPEKILTFKDIPERAKNTLAFLQSYEIVNGKTETMFGANDPITRGEAAVILARAYKGVLKTPAEPVHRFTDATGRYAEAISQLAAARIVNGKTSDRFGTKDPVTRGDFAIMVARLSDPALSPPSVYGDLLSSKGGLSIEAEKKSYHMLSDSSVELTLTNTAEFSYTRSRLYSLEKKHENKWVKLQYVTGLQFPADMLPIAAGETQKINLSFDSFKPLITPGEYRVSHTYYPAGNEEENVSIAAYFTVTE